MVKTKKAMRDYECYSCKTKIKKGEQYARKSVVVGKTTIWAHETPVPDWAWRTHREAMPICEHCNTNWVKIQIDKGIKKAGEHIEDVDLAIKDRKIEDAIEDKIRKE